MVTTSLINIFHLIYFTKKNKEKNNNIFPHEENSRFPLLTTFIYVIQYAVIFR